MVGENIKKLRKGKGLSLSELAVRADIAKSYLSNIERNVHNPSIYIVAKISSALQVDLATLLQSEIEDYMPLVEEEWIELIHELKEEGLEVDHIRDSISLIKFIKWRSENKKGFQP